MRRLPLLVVLVALTFVPLETSAGVRTTDAAPTLNNFQLVGHNPLNSRGMNAAPAIFDHFVYVGNRTDGSAHHINPGVLILDVANPANPTIMSNPPAPTQAGVFSPDPLPFVGTEDPALSEGRNKVVMWSYPIIKDGLIYLIDLRNGLYVLRYTGPGAAFVDRITFLEGNSNLGDAARLERTSRPRTPSIGGPGG